MIRSRALLLTVTTLALVAAAPAGALTGYGVSAPLRVTLVPAGGKSGTEQQRTCQAKSGKQKTDTSHTLVVQVGSKA